MTSVTRPEEDPAEHDLGGAPRSRAMQLGGKTGVLSRQQIQILINRRLIQAAADLDPTQLQPSSLDLRLGLKAYRVRASFLPGPEQTVEKQLGSLTNDEISLDDGAVLERGCVYVVELQETLRLTDGILAFANPKSSTGRLDVFTRLIADRSDVFDRVPLAYDGRLYAEISPRSFSVKVRAGSRLNQIRFRRRTGAQDQHADMRLSDAELMKLHASTPLVDADIRLRNGVALGVELARIGGDNLIGYRAQRHTNVIDVDRVNHYAIADFWEPIHARSDRRLILDPNEFYILASKEQVHIPASVAAEMVPIDPAMGEFRVHYAGFFDPGFGGTPDGKPGSHAVLEVRSHEVPFVLEDGQIVGRLAYEWMSTEPDGLYGEALSSNYQGQKLKLSKHFR
ncbi:MAG: 2'-deoxycytidine 5'-triphosphate deaminase [Beijerinckiaceae bacterium]